jgi:hypothetical protein
MMKFIFTTAFLLVSVLFYGQLSTRDIKKFKIASAAETSSFNEDGMLQKLVYTTYYDKDGNDTALYSGALCIYKKNYVLDANKRIVSVMVTDKEGTESERTEYAYEPDGNYSTSSLHKSLSTVYKKWFDKNGRLLKEQRENELTLFYDYNAKGQLVQVMTKLGPSGKGDIVHLKYTYNSKGQLVKEESIGTWLWVKTMYYDARGLLIKTITTAKEADHTHITTNTYQYTFWK